MDDGYYRSIFAYYGAASKGMIEIDNPQLAKEYKELLEHVESKSLLSDGNKIHPNRTKYTLNRERSYRHNFEGKVRYLMKDKFPILHHFDSLLAMYDMAYIMLYDGGFSINQDWRRGTQALDFKFKPNPIPNPTYKQLY